MVSAARMITAYCAESQSLARTLWNAAAEGLADVYNVLVELQRPAEPPAEETLRHRWQNDRKTQQSEAEAVFGRASPELRVEFVLHKAEERRVVLQLLGKLPAIPQPFAAVFARWTKDEDRQVAEQASRLLDRD